MAGIGFRLERLLERDSWTADALAYGGATLVLCGAWVFSVVSIVVVGRHASAHLPPREAALFLAALTTACCGAAVLNAPCMLPAARYLADRLFAGDAGAFGPCAAGLSLVLSCAAAAASIAFAAHTALPAGVQLAFVLLAVGQTQLWLGTAVMAALRTYAWVAGSYLVGQLAGAAAAIALGGKFGLPGYLSGYAAGVCLSATLLALRLQRDLSYPRAADHGALATARARPALAGIGLALAAGTWGDKLVLWWWPGLGVPLAPGLRCYPPYDASFFLAALTGLPALVVMFLRLETDLARRVRAVYAALTTHQPPGPIARARRRLQACARAICVETLQAQAPVTLAVLVLAPALVRGLALSPEAVPMLRLAALAAPGVVLLQLHVLLLLYLDQPERALAPCAVYALACPALTAASAAIAPALLGLGHLIAAWGAATWARSRAIDAVRWMDHEALARAAALRG